MTRKRFAIGPLNRHSLLYLQKGRARGSGAYRGGIGIRTKKSVQSSMVCRLPIRKYEVQCSLLAADQLPVASSA